ncbi:iron permease FTR1/Fip1/EfeU [Gorgonomyces haynaldii]|nr:iron permease FTR1/Fip1/EfeU [Gorgonomyces haynaldii]
MSLFSVPLFFVIFREALEVAIILSVLLSFLGRLEGNTRTLSKMVWIGTGTAFVLCLAIGGALIGVWYTYGRNLFEENEMLIEGILMLIASVFIAATGLGFANGRELYDKIHRKLTDKIDGQLEKDLDSKANKTLFFLIPFVTVLREGLESVLLFAGVGFNEPPSSIPIAAIVGILTGAIIGFILHKLSGRVSLRWFFVIAAYILFLMAGGMFSKAVGEFEEYSYVQYLATQGITGEAAEEVPIPFFRQNVLWYFPYWSEDNGIGWGLLETLVGYKSTSTIGMVTAYCLYWFAILAVLFAMKMRPKQSVKSNL